MFFITKCDVSVADITILIHPYINMTYPKYRKVGLNPEKEDAEAMKASRRCSKCFKRWPNDRAFLMTKSPCCKVKMTLSLATPTLTWKEAVLKLFHSRFDEYYDDYLASLSEAELMWLQDGLAILSLPDHFVELVEEVDEVLKRTLDENKNC